MTRRFGLVALLATAAVAAYAMGWLQDLRLSALSEHYVAWREVAETQRWRVVAIYVLAFGVLTAACLPIALILTLLGGALLGTWTGGLATIVGVQIAALLSYGASRSALGGWLVRLAARHPRFEDVLAGFRRESFYYLLALRLAPAIPFAGVNVAAGAARTPLIPFVTATLLASIPTSLLYSRLGGELARSTTDAAGLHPRDLAQPGLVWTLAALAALSLGGALLKRRMRLRGLAALPESHGQASDVTG